MGQRPYKVLILDDELDMAESLERILRRAGFETVVETESVKALHCIEWERPDLLLTDLHMPDLDGMALLEQIRYRQWAIPVIMLTAYPTEDASVEARHKGASDYLAKSCSAVELVLRVQKVLSHHIGV